MSREQAVGEAKDVRAIAVIGLAHGLSHFFQLVLPPLFPLLVIAFDVGYTELGAMMTVFFVTSGLSQPPAGFLVDRFGARMVLIWGLLLYCVAIALAAAAPTFWFLFPLAALAGLGNSVFHPADFTILNATVRAERLGRAYGVHTFGGNLGWAAAPILMIQVGTAFGWRWALLSAAAIGFAVIVVIWFFRHDLHEERAPRHAPAGGVAVSRIAALAPLFSRPVLLCFGYFVLLACALIAVQNFLPPTLGQLHATPLKLANAALTGFLIGAAGGVMTGGFLADRTRRHTLIVAGGLAAAAILFLIVGAWAMPTGVLIAMIAAAGFLSGLTTPSRDMLVRDSTPRGATGRVFGFVYSGLDAGSALAPATVGYLLDHGRANTVIVLIAATLAAAILTAIGIGRRSPRAFAAAD